jgi:hypothetical protein
MSEEEVARESNLSLLTETKGKLLRTSPIAHVLLPMLASADASKLWACPRRRLSVQTLFINCQRRHCCLIFCLLPYMHYYEKLRLRLCNSLAAVQPLLMLEHAAAV